jgi:hypothetical protein
MNCKRDLIVFIRFIIAYDCMHEEERETVCHQLGSLQDAADKVSMNLNDVI